MLQQYRYYKTSGLSETKKKILFENGHGHGHAVAAAGSGGGQTRAHVQECAEACVTVENACDDSSEPAPGEAASASHALDAAPDVSCSLHVAALEDKAEESREQHSDVAHVTHDHHDEEVTAAAHVADLLAFSAVDVQEGTTSSCRGKEADGGSVEQRRCDDDEAVSLDDIRGEKHAAAAATLGTQGSISSESAENASSKFPAISEACTQMMMLSSTSSLHSSAEHIGAAIKDAVTQASAATGCNPRKLVLQYRKSKRSPHQSVLSCDATSLLCVACLE